MSANTPKDPIPVRDDGAPWRNFYGRRKGKTLRKSQIEHLATTLPALEIPGIGWAENPDRAALDPGALFPRPGPLMLEIGFGGGEHLSATAMRRPQTNFIGCEPYVNGVAMLLPKLADAGLDNVRLHAGDARDLLDVLPDASLSRCYLLYPDPWPKKRHHRRRFVQPETLGPLARVLRPGAEFRVATDIPDYARHTLEHLLRQPKFEWLAERPGDWREPWPDWPGTRYESKALKAGRTPCYLRFRRR